MVAGKVKTPMGFQKSPAPPTPPPSTANNKSSSHKSSFSRSFGAYFPRSSAQVQPRPPDVTELLRLVEDLRERESRLKTELLEHKLLKETVAIVPVLENEIIAKDKQIENNAKKIEQIEAENQRLRKELKELKLQIEEEKTEHQHRTKALEDEIAELKKTASGNNRAPPLQNDDVSSSSSQKFQGLVEVSVRSNLIKTLNKTASLDHGSGNMKQVEATVTDFKREVAESERPRLSRCDSEELTDSVVTRSQVVEFYHSLMRRESQSRRESISGVAEVTPTANPRDMIGEIENRSSHLLAIKTDVETQGDFIRCLIKEVEGAAFTDIEDAVHFVKWLDDELSYLVDERAVLKHFDWPEQKADALREAAFGYCDLKKLESEASSFRDNPRQPCGPALKKMQALLEKLEHGVYNISRMRESATNRYKVFQIPIHWMLDNGFLSQIKLASVKLAMKYMKRVSAELETVGGGPEEEELIVQGVRFAFRVHQFAGGFDVETMRAFQELRDKARTCHLQCHSQQQKFFCRSATC
ncbi:Protein CHUP1, chloroplastic [Sesbania bispinosa]|nr:Protein CHUP1, chloroplastic [Sesbania bispinosa]